MDPDTSQIDPVSPPPPPPALATDPIPAGVPIQGNDISSQPTASNAGDTPPEAPESPINDSTQSCPIKL